MRASPRHCGLDPQSPEKTSHVIASREAAWKSGKRTPRHCERSEAIHLFFLSGFALIIFFFLYYFAASRHIITFFWIASGCALAMTWRGRKVAAVIASEAKQSSRHVIASREAAWQSISFFSWIASDFVLAMTGWASPSG
ncbi:MAG: hypothetical protein LBE71_03830 [Dysgonamonadaceae bacterium]|nr:hypothetical protein [Dysgonamonadaceae bacterium]